MKNKLMSMYEKITLRQRYIIECINELLKNKANIVHSCHRSIHNFIMNICAALTAYCFLTTNLMLLMYHSKILVSWLFSNIAYPELA